MNPYDIISYPLMTEVASRLLETENKLVFIVNLKSTKPKIRRAVEELYDVRVQRVNVLITPKGKKKAFVKLHPDFKAVDVAIRLGII